MPDTISRPPMQPVPLWFKFLTSLPYARHRVFRWLRRKGALDRLVSIPFHDRCVAVPLRESTFGWGPGLGDYQIRRIARFAAMCDGAMGEFDFLDCGAYLGLFAAQFAMHSYGVRQLTLIEPNRELFPLLESNLRGARARQVRYVNAALSDFEGRGRLVMPEYGSSADALFLDPDPAGDVEVITLSSLLRNRTHPNVAIKIDVEGQEGPVLHAACDEIRSLDRVVLMIELHKQVLDRIAVADVDMVEEIDAIRSFRWVRARDGAPVNPHRSIFGQVGATQCDLIGVSE